MRNIIKLFAFAGIIALTVASCYKSDIEFLKSQIDVIKSSDIATIDSQIAAINGSIGELKSADANLKALISALQEDGQKYAHQIADLTAMDKTIEGRIAELQSYVDSGINGTKDWVSATFATLEQLDSLCAVVAAIPSQIEAVKAELDSAKIELTSSYTDAINAAVISLETSMKSWVNEQLDDYYTIAQIDASLNDIVESQNSADSTLAAQIEEQRVALDTARSQITTAYQKAIEEAINTFEGKINTKIATDIETAKNALQTQIDLINQEITEIKGRLDAIEVNIEALVNQIQSIVVIPTYTDGSVRITDFVDTISFDLRPARLADSLASAWAAADTAQRKKMISIKVKEVNTKVGENPAAGAAVDSVFCSEGELKVISRFSKPEAKQSASLQISCAKSEYSTQYFFCNYYDTGHFCLVAREDGVSVSLTGEDGVLEFSLQYFKSGDREWSDYTFKNEVKINKGEKVFFKATTTNDRFRIEGNYGGSHAHFVIDGYVDVRGNIMFLLDGSTPSAKVNSNAFIELFFNCKHLVGAKNLILPATTLASNCYNSMFYGCNNLESAPLLPATTLTNCCYESMFKGCSKLSSVTMLATNIPEDNCLYNWLKDAGTSATERKLYVDPSMVDNSTIIDNRGKYTIYTY